MSLQYNKRFQHDQATLMIGSMLEAHEKEKIAEIANGYLGYLHERIPRKQ